MLSGYILPIYYRKYQNIYLNFDKNNDINTISNTSNDFYFRRDEEITGVDSNNQELEVIFDVFSASLF